jgi:hypothetical protein
VVIVPLERNLLQLTYYPILALVNVHTDVLTVTVLFHLLIVLFILKMATALQASLSDALMVLVH